MPQASLLVVTESCIPSRHSSWGLSTPVPACLLMNWENSLTEYPDSLGEALAWLDSKVGVDAQGTAATGVEAGPLHCPIVPSLQLWQHTQHPAHNTELVFNTTVTCD